MEEDVLSKEFYSVEERYADLINGIGFQGRQVVKKEDLSELDTQTGIWKMSFGRRKRKRSVRNRDLIRKMAFGVNFAVVGIENQEYIDYALPLRNMSYDVSEYERQALKIRKEVRKGERKLEKGGKVDMCGAIAGLIEEGKIEGKLEGIRALIETCEEFNVSREETLERIVDKFSLSTEKAEVYMNNYWSK